MVQLRGDWKAKEEMSLKQMKMWSWIWRELLVSKQLYELTVCSWWSSMSWKIQDTHWKEQWHTACFHILHALCPARAWGRTGGRATQCDPDGEQEGLVQAVWHSIFLLVSEGYHNRPAILMKHFSKTNTK